MTATFRILAAAVLLVSAPTLALGQDAPSHTPLYSPAQLVRMIQRGEPVVFLDVREPQEFKVNHIPGALNIPQRELAARRAELPAGALVIPYCNMDFRGFQAVAALAKIGVERIGLMQKHGLNGWRDQKLPVVEHGVSDAEALAKLATVNPDQLADVQPAPRVEATGNVVRLKMEAADWYFEPNDLTVKAGDRVEIELSSIQGDHSFVMPDFELDQKLHAGDTTLVTFVADQRGEFRFGSCEWAGEALQVMKGRIKVE